MKKKAMEFGFGWIFAVLIGAFIIFLAIYMTSHIVTTMRLQQETIAGKQLGTLLTPVETNLEEAKLAQIILPQETKLINSCVPASSSKPFGIQQISTQISSGVGGKWTAESGVPSPFQNKYLFSENESLIEKNLYILSKPFEFPFKIADIIVAWPDTKTYCFVSAPTEIKKEFTDLNAPNIFFSSSESNCPPATTKKVCFSSSCEITVNEARETVTKNKQTLNYQLTFSPSDKYALLYAAIFSSPEIYQCQIKRLMARASELSSLYLSKSEYLTPRGCTSPVLQIDLQNFRDETSNADMSKLSALKSLARDLKSKNDPIVSCKLF